MVANRKCVTITKFHDIHIVAKVYIFFSAVCEMQIYFKKENVVCCFRDAISKRL